MSTSDEINARMQELQRALDEARAVLAPLNNEEASLQAEMAQVRKAFEQQINDMTAKMQDIVGKKQIAWQQQKNSEWELAKLQAEQQKAAEKAAKAVADAQAAEEEARKHAVLTDLFDKLTIAAHWREWAKDHQIQGAHFLTENRNVILADPMGLGKTLTAIATADMVQQYTRKATTEFPLLGMEKEKIIPQHFAWTELAQQAQQAGSDPRLQHYAQIIAGNQSAYLPYDRRQNFLAEGLIEKVEVQKVKEIVNSIDHPVGLRVLYLCPATLIGNVEEEWRRWAPHRNVAFISGMSKVEREFLFTKVLPSQEHFTVVCNYEAWSRDKSLLEMMIQTKFDTVIVDEAHRALNPKTSTRKGILRILEETSPPVAYRIPMTGTPILNRCEDLYYMLNMVNPEKFSHPNDFLYSYCQQVEDEEGRMRWIFKEGGLDRLIPLIRTNFLRRTRDQAGIVLPEKTIIHHDIDIDEEAYPLQGKARREMSEYMTVICDEKAGKAISAAAVVAMYTRLRQIETWPAGIIQYHTWVDDKGSTHFVRDPNTGEKVIKLQLNVEESQKMDYLIKRDNDTGEWDGLIPEGIAEERGVLFSQFKQPLRELKKRIDLSGKRAVILDGDTPKDLLAEIRRDFDRRETPDRSKAKWDIVLCNYKVGGVGLNFTAATQCFILDEEWGPGKRDQAYDRLHRIGQEEAITIHVVRARKIVPGQTSPGGIDTWLATLMEQKEGIVNGFTGAAMSLSTLKEALDSGLI